MSREPQAPGSPVCSAQIRWILEVNFDHLIPRSTVTACPYNGITSSYWSIRVGEQLHPDLPGPRTSPTGQLLPIAGLIYYYNEKVDMFLDGQRRERSTTHFFKATPDLRKQHAERDG